MIRFYFLKEKAIKTLAQKGKEWQNLIIICSQPILEINDVFNKYY